MKAAPAAGVVLSFFTPPAVDVYAPWPMFCESPPSIVKVEPVQ